MNPRTLGRQGAGSILAFVLIYAAIGFHFGSLRFALSVLLGGLIAILNFWAIARSLRGFGETAGAGAAFFYVAKVLLLFLAMGLLMGSGRVHSLGLIVGFSALAPGIVVLGLRREQPGGDPPA